MHFLYCIARFVKIKNKENLFDLFLFEAVLKFMFVPLYGMRIELQQNHVLT